MSGSNADADRRYGGGRSDNFGGGSSWLSRVRGAQMERSPVEVKAAIERGRRMNTALRQAARCSSLRTKSVGLNRVFSSAIRSVSAAAPSSFGFGSFNTARRGRSMEGAAAPPQDMLCSAAVDEMDSLAEEAFDDAVEARSIVEDLAILESNVETAAGATHERAMALAISAAAEDDAESTRRMASDTDQLVEQLRNEPADDAEAETRFKLYEAFFEKIVKLRAELDALFVECVSCITTAGKPGLKREMSKIDHPTNLSVADPRPGEWIAAGMVAAVARNLVKLTQFLDSLQQRLKLEASQTECPICLDGFGGKQVEVLSCFHRVCTECWDEWGHVCNGQPMCPLCRHDEFIERLASA